MTGCPSRSTWNAPSSASDRAAIGVPRTNDGELRTRVRAVHALYITCHRPYKLRQMILDQYLHTPCKLSCTLLIAFSGTLKDPSLGKCRYKIRHQDAMLHGF